MNRGKNILEKLRSGQEDIFIEIYRNYRDSFIQWTEKKYSSDRDTASDCFQDAIIILMDNVRSGKLVNLDSGLKTYLFSVGKNVLLKKHRVKRNEIAYEDVPVGFDPEVVDNNYELNKHKSRLIERIAEMTMNMKEPCKSILKHYYYENLSMEKIAILMKYKNANTVKSQKIRCMKYLEESLGNEFLLQL